MIHASRLGYMIDNGERLSIHCENQWCNHRASTYVDLDSLATRLGREHSTLATDLQRYFCCSACKSAGRVKKIGFIHHAATKSATMGPITEMAEQYRKR